jgi:hypothetical protein
MHNHLAAGIRYRNDIKEWRGDCGLADATTTLTSTVFFNEEIRSGCSSYIFTLSKVRAAFHCNAKPKMTAEHDSV